MSLTRILALFEKELRDTRATTAFVLPALVTVLLLALPFAIVTVIPMMTGEPLDTGDADITVAQRARAWPALGQLSPQGTVQAFLFDQFLLLLVLAPVMSATSIAAFGIAGEKHEKSLEPLLATPITTAELVIAKLAAAALPALAIELGAVTLYVLLIALTAESGVVNALANRRTALLVLLIGPLVTLVALQLSLLASTRAQDPRSAQQWSALLVLPVTGIFAAQVSGAVWVGLTSLLITGLVLLLVWLGLLGLTLRLFDRETILTRWR